MKVVVVGGGYAGLSTAYRLLELGHEVTLFEKQRQLGGLAVSFSKPGWEWGVEKYYHHWFTNDRAALGLAKEIGHQVQVFSPSTDILYGGRVARFDSLQSVLAFPHLSLVDKLRVGMGVAYLKMSSNYRRFESKTALTWINKFMGKRAREVIWEPLFRGKFERYQDKISLTWFWARIKKRTPQLAYPEGGFGAFSESLVKKIAEKGGRIVLGAKVNNLQVRKRVVLTLENGERRVFDRAVVTVPSLALPAMIPQLPKDYLAKLASIEHLWAQVLVLRLKRPLLKNTYWLNVTEPSSPFVALVEHTNLVPKRYYGGEHLVYIGNYLPSGHEYLGLTKSKLLSVFDPQLTKINKDYRKYLLDFSMFKVPGAQPIVETNYQQKIPALKALEKLYIANIDMVYPWDRGTNYAIELGERVARLVDATK